MKLILCTIYLLILQLSNAAVSHPPPAPSINWKSFGFSMNGVETDKMYLDTLTVSGKKSWKSADSKSKVGELVVPLATIALHPAATILNYGQGLFEGLKAFRRKVRIRSIISFRLP